MTEITVGLWKTMKILLLVSLIAAVGGIACNRLPNLEPEVQNREVVLLYTNDFESAYDPILAFWRDDLEYIGGVAELASSLALHSFCLERERRETI